MLDSITLIYPGSLTKRRLLKVAEPLLDRVRRALGIVWGHSDCVKLIQYQGTNVEFSGVAGTVGPFKASIAALKTQHVELVAATDAAVQLDTTQYLLCLDRDEYPKGNPTREWINQKRRAAMGAILYFATAFQAFVADHDTGRSELDKAMAIIRDLAQSMSGGGPSPGAPAARPPPPPEPTESAPPSISRTGKRATRQRDLTYTEFMTTVRQTRPGKKSAKRKQAGVIQIPSEQSAVISTLSQLGIDPRDFPD